MRDAFSQLDEYDPLTEIPSGIGAPIYGAPRHGDALATMRNAFGHTTRNRHIPALRQEGLPGSSGRVLHYGSAPPEKVRLQGTNRMARPHLGEAPETKGNT